MRKNSFVGFGVSVLIFSMAYGVLLFAQTKSAPGKRLFDSLENRKNSQVQRSAVSLYDFENHKPADILAGQPLLPQRVYLAPNPDAGGSPSYVLTQFDGALPQPLEFIRDGSVLSGARLGAKNLEQNYVLTKEGTWVPTPQLEHYYFWVLTTPRLIKVVVWRNLPFQ